jgi:hypothetical protein
LAARLDLTGRCRRDGSIFSVMVEPALVAKLSHPLRKRSFVGVAVSLCIAALLSTLPACAEVFEATPANYRAIMQKLKPGDTVNLGAGTYMRLPIVELHGKSEAWITFRGPAEGPPAVITSEGDRYNLIQILNSSYIAIENLRLDSRGIPGVFGISAAHGDDNRVHNIRVEGNVFVGQGGAQQTVAISILTSTWGWIIRRNQILGAGTGIYLGQSDGTQPFVQGIIENNLIKDSIGYNMQIKEQVEIPLIPGMPIWPTSTIIRNNVFIKNDQPSPDGDRPNLLLSAFPASGHGSMNMYEVHGNLFVHNHREALLQVSGRASIHDNIFVDGPYSSPAVVFRAQKNSPLKVARFYNNTIYTPGRGVYFGSRALMEDMVVGNLIFALTSISGAVTHQASNVVDLVDHAGLYVKAPSFELGSMDFRPLAGKCQGLPIDLSPFQSDQDYTVDFDGTSKSQVKGTVVFRGAYASDASSPEVWQLQAVIKPPRAAASGVTLVWLEPAVAHTGTTRQITLTGANFSEGATVELSGPGVAVSEVKVSSTTEITATITVAGNAPAGTRDVTVGTPSGSSNPIKLRVSAQRGKT